MSGMRVLCVWLVLMVATAPSWLDRCLVRCHEASTLASPPCHEEAASAMDGPAWQSTDACRHDHDATWVAAPDPRQASGLRLALAGPSGVLALAASFGPCATPAVPAVSPPPTHSASIPLRL